MLRLKIAIQTRCLRQPLRRAIETAASLGAEGVEIDARHELRPSELSQTGLRELRKLLGDLGLAVAAVGFPTRRGYDVAEDLDRRVGATREAMQLAARLGAPVVVNQIGRVPDDESGSAWQSLVEVLTDLGMFGNRIGVRLAAETGTEPGSRLAALLAAAPEGSVAATLDPGNLAAAGYSVAEAIEALGPAIAHVHVRDSVRDAAGRGFEVALGEGQVDFPDLLASLDEFGYRGALSIERNDGEKPIDAVGAAVNYLRGL